MPGFENLHVSTTSPEELSRRQWTDIQRVRFDYYTSVMPEDHRWPGLVFTNMTTPETWANPNLSVGSHLTRSGQRFARAEVATAVNMDTDELKGFVFFADNASSTHPSLIGAVERFAKLRVPISPFVDSRYRVLREVVMPGYIVGDDDEYEIAMRDMLFRAVAFAKEQPVNAYLLNREDQVALLLESLGMRQDHEFPQTPVFDADTVSDPSAAYIIKLSHDRASDFADRIMDY